MIDVVGANAVPSAPEPHLHYVPGRRDRVGYRVEARPEAPIRVSRLGGRVRLEDLESGVAGDGPSYLDAIQTLERAVRERGEWATE
jgi:hypothetical protein